MLYWTAVFLVIAIISAIFGFGGLVTGAVGVAVAKTLFFIFMVLFLLTLAYGCAAIEKERKY